MLDIIMVALFGDPIANTLVPAVSDCAVTTWRAGSCFLPRSGLISQSAVLLISWTLTNPNSTLYGLKVYRDGSLVTTLSGADGSYEHDQLYIVSETGHVTGDSFPATWLYRVDVYRLSDGVVVSTSTAPSWFHWYSYCH